MTVLLVDDDADALVLLQMVLARRGIPSVLASSVAEARLKLGDDHSGVDVVVTDFELGDGDGMELHALRGPLVKTFVVLTGRTTLSAPADVCVLRKPLDVQQLLAVIAPDLVATR